MTLEKITKMFFDNNKRFILINNEMTCIPLMAANVHKSTLSFAAGQLVYIYDGFWGMAERVKVVGRYRRKQRVIRGICSVDNLENHRPKIVYDPRIINKLDGQRISVSIF